LLVPYPEPEDHMITLERIMTGYAFPVSNVLGKKMKMFILHFQILTVNAVTKMAFWFYVQYPVLF